MIVLSLAYFTCMCPITVIGGRAPTPFFSCTDYHCDEGETVTLSEDQWRQVVSLFPPTESPADEREHIRRAIALLESQVGKITGTWRDLAKNVAGAGLPGQLDCISESKNTTTYLQLLSQDGLIQWHEVEDRKLRSPWILDLHWSAVIRDRRTGERYAVDSWFLDNGQQPFIQPLDEWLSGRRFDSAQQQQADK
ncbi:MAG: hypothetical protein ABF290_05915 [Thiogranum sp.]